MSRPPGPRGWATGAGSGSAAERWPRPAPLPAHAAAGMPVSRTGGRLAARGQVVVGRRFGLGRSRARRGERRRWDGAGRSRGGLGGRRGGRGGRRGGRRSRGGRGRRGIRHRGRRHPTDVEATLEPVEARGVAGLTGGTGQQDAGRDELELEAGRGGAGHLGEPGVDDVGGPGERPGAERGRLEPHPLELVLGHVPQHLAGAVGQGRHDDEVAQPLEEVLDEAPRVEAGLDHLVDGAEDGCRVAGGEGVDGGVEQLAVGEAEQGRGRLVGEALGAGPRDELVEHRQRVTHRTATRAHDERQHARGHRDALLDAELLHVGLQPGRGDEPERVVVGARADGADDLLGLGGGEDELHVLGRLLDDLEQRVEALRRHHVRLVDDVDLVAALGRARRTPVRAGHGRRRHRRGSRRRSR